jgi:uncharacterized protein YndB with AHSA1/START domain
MQPLHFTTKIHAPRGNVWHALWDDATFRQWTNVIDEGTYMVGTLEEGAQVQFISGSSGYGVTSLVKDFVPYELISFLHEVDTMETGTANREDEWTGGEERYILTEENGVTTLSVTVDVPEELVEMMQERYPQAFAVVRELAENHATK